MKEITICSCLGGGKQGLRRRRREQSRSLKRMRPSSGRQVLLLLQQSQEDLSPPLCSLKGNVGKAACVPQHDSVYACATFTNGFRVSYVDSLFQTLSLPVSPASFPAACFAYTSPPPTPHPTPTPEAHCSLLPKPEEGFVSRNWVGLSLVGEETEAGGLTSPKCP